MTHKLTHSDKDTRGILNRLFVLFEVLDTAGMDCLRAIASNMADYEGAVMIETALRYGIDCIVTRNPKDYTGSALPVYASQLHIPLSRMRSFPTAWDES